MQNGDSQERVGLGLAVAEAQRCESRVVAIFNGRRSAVSENLFASGFILYQRLVAGLRSQISICLIQAMAWPALMLRGFW